MIRVALNGGLGNQMFQYAAAKSLAVKNNTTVSFDLIPLYSKLQIKNKATFRQFELDVFSIDAKKNKPYFLNKYLYPLAKSVFYLSRLFNKMRFNFYSEKSFEFDNAFFNQQDNTYLNGHFQSEKYFKEIEAIIRKELVFRNQLTDKNLIWKSKIENCNSVSIHIRRGDYVLLQKNLNKHGVASLEFYQKAVQLITHKINEAYFFVFTDDISWVKDNFSIAGPYEIIDNNNSPKTSYMDMQLMSYCKHNIICNSTFSWWAAWLNNNPEKLVIAPDKWFEDSTINSKDIYPPEWIKL